MPGTPATSPKFGAPRYADGDTASFSAQLNGVTDVFDAAALKSGGTETLASLSVTGAGTALSVTNNATIGGQVTLTGTGSGAGLVIGGDATLYRSAASTLRTAGKLIVDSDATISGALTVTGASNVGAVNATGGYTQTGAGTNTFSGVTTFSAAGTALVVTNSASVGGSLSVTGSVTGQVVVASGLTGAVQASRHAGATASGAPSTGTFAKGDFVVAQDGHIFVCTVGGSPGTWVDVVGSAGAVTSVFGRTGAITAAGGDYTVAQVTGAAPLASPTFSGTVTIPTAAVTTFSGTPNFSGAATGQTAAVDTNTTQLATAAFVLGQAASATPLVASGAGSVGTSTRYARADHVHPASSSGSISYGDGSDGAATCDGATAVAGMSRSGSTYTMTRDCYFTNLTVNAGVTVVEAGFRMFGTGTLTINATGLIHNNGSAGVTTVVGAGGLAGFYVGGANGGASNGSGGSLSAVQLGLGGAGGGGGSTAGGTTNAPTAAEGGIPHEIATILSNHPSGGSSGLQYGGGGGGGAGNAITGGGGGGVVAIVFKTVVNNGAIQARGGAGAAGSGTNVNSGGGGGGFVFIASASAVTGTGTIDANGGAAGTGGSGAAGHAGSNGNVVQVVGV